MVCFAVCGKNYICYVFFFFFRRKTGSSFLTEELTRGFLYFPSHVYKKSANEVENEGERKGKNKVRKISCYNKWRENIESGKGMNQHKRKKCRKYKISWTLKITPRSLPLYIGDNQLETSKSKLFLPLDNVFRRFIDVSQLFRNCKRQICEIPYHSKYDYCPFLSVRH